MLRFKTDQALPPALARSARHRPHRPVKALTPARSSILATLRAGGCRAEDRKIGRADLGRAEIWKTCSSTCMSAGGASTGCLGTLFRKEVLRFWKVSFQTVAAPVLTAVLYLLIFGHVLEDHVRSTTASATPAS